MTSNAVHDHPLLPARQMLSPSPSSEDNDMLIRRISSVGTDNEDVIVRVPSSLDSKDGKLLDEAKEDDEIQIEKVHNTVPIVT